MNTTDSRNHPDYDPTIHCFFHEEKGEMVWCDRVSMKTEWGVDTRPLFQTNPNKTIHGWQLLIVKLRNGEEI